MLERQRGASPIYPDRYGVNQADIAEKVLTTLSGVPARDAPLNLPPGFAGDFINAAKGARAKHDVCGSGRRARRHRQTAL